MAPSTVGQTPSLSTFLKSLKQNDIGTSIELFISMLKRRQIRYSRQCAIATAQLLLRVVSAERWRDVNTLINRIRDVGKRLIAAQPRELAVGNIVRRILGVVREVVEEDPSSPTPTTPATDVAKNLTSASEALQKSRPPMLHAFSSFAGQQPQPTSLFGLLEQPDGSPSLTPSASTPALFNSPTRRQTDSTPKVDIKAEVIDGIRELLDELEVVDTQIAESALEHIHDSEVILTHTSSQTIHRFLLSAAKRRKFTVIHAESYPNDHHATHLTIVNGAKKSFTDDGATAFDDPSSPAEDARWKPLTSIGIKVILIPDTAAFALMSRVHKVLLAPHAVMANGSLIAAAGSSSIAQAAHEHRVPVVVLTGVYKLSPVYPHRDLVEMVEYGDPGAVVGYGDGEFLGGVDVVNPVFDVVASDLVDLYITNIGAHAPNALYRIVEDHYRAEDVELDAEM